MLGNSPDASQRRLSCTRSNRVCAHWYGKEGAGYKRQTRPTARIWEGMTSDQYRERSRHEPGANLSARGERAPTDLWLEWWAPVGRGNLAGKEEEVKEKGAAPESSKVAPRSHG